MARYGLRPSKPRAVLIAVLVSAMAIFELVQFARSGHFEWFFLLWMAVAIFIVAAALRQGFGSKPGRGAPVDVDDSGDRPRGSHRLWGMAAVRDEADGPYRLRPSKTMAVVAAIGGAGMIGLAVVVLHGPFVVLWVAFVVALTGFNLWSAFGRKGADSILERRD
jgi:peptidoglycan/LPS O-acetylase OafA/YrhL